MVSRRIYSSYLRQLADTACGAQEVLIDLHARQYFCGNDACVKTTFTEQALGLTVQLTGRLAYAVSRSTLLRLIRAAADPDEATR